MKMLNLSPNVYNTAFIILGQDKSGIKSANQWDEWWFLTDPESFLSRHLPMDKTGELSVRTDCQLVPNPTTNVTEWDKAACVNPNTHAFHFEAVSHTVNHGLVQTGQNELHMTFRCSKPLIYFGDLEEVTTLEKYNSHILIYTSHDDIIHVVIRAQGRGTFRLKLCGLLDSRYCDDALAHCGLPPLIAYTIEYTGLVDTPHPFPSLNTFWGPQCTFLDAGCYFNEYIGAVINTDRGQASLELHLPSSGVTSVYHKLVHTSELDIPLNRNVYAEKVITGVVYHLLCTEEGEYRFEVQFATKLKDQSRASATFLICCSSPASKEKLYPTHWGVWGPNEQCSMIKVCPVNFESSTIDAEKGRCKIKMYCTQPVNLCHSLCDTNDREYTDWPSCIQADITGNVITYNLRIPTPGIYKFTIAHKQEVIATYIVHCKKGCGKELFPEYKQLWGPTDIATSFRMECVPTDTSIKTIYGECKIVLKMPIDVSLTHDIYKGKCQTVANHMNYVYADKGDGHVTYHIKTPEPGMYGFRIYADNSGSVKGLKVAFNFLIKSEEGYKGSLYPAHEGPWGGTPQISLFGLTVKQPSSSTTVQADVGICQTVLYYEDNLLLRYKLHNVNDELVPGYQHRVYGEYQGGTIKVTCHTPSEGLFKLSIWASRDSYSTITKVASFLVESSCGYPEPEPLPPVIGGIWGVNTKLLPHGFRLKTQLTHPVIATNREFTLTVECCHGITDIEHMLCTPSGEMLKHHVYLEEDECHVNYHMRLPQDGYYCFTLTTTSTATQVASICINCVG